MNNTITTREEALLAKLAGRDADLSTFTPPVASNLKEKLMLEIADRLDNGISGSSLEVVAEIEVGEMQWDDELNFYTYLLNTEHISLPKDKQLYFNSKDCPLTYDDVTSLFGYNYDDTSYEFTGDVGYAITDSVDQSIWSLHDDISNTTVKILADASSGGLLIPVYTESDNVYTCDTSLDTILEAVKNGTCVCAKFERRYYALDFMEDDYVRFSYTDSNVNGAYYKSIVHELDKGDEEIHWYENSFTGNIPVVHYNITYNSSTGNYQATYDSDFASLTNIIYDGGFCACQITPAGGGGVYAVTSTGYIYPDLSAGLIYVVFTGTAVLSANSTPVTFTITHAANDTITFTTT